MKKYLFHVGIDISKLKLDVVVISAETTNSVEHFIVDNTQKGVKAIIRSLIKRKIDLTTILFCCENTGVYTFPLRAYLSEKHLDYCIVPAIEIKRSKGITRGKNDKTDAKDIALYSIRNIDKLQLSAIAEKEIQQLRLLYTEREKVMKSLLLFGASKENEAFTTKEIYKVVALVNAKTIQALQNSLKFIEAKMKEIIKNHVELNQQFELIKSVPGVRQQTAIYLIIATKGFKAFTSSRKFACYAGVAPFEYRSGSSVRGRTKVSNMADKKMKSLLQMCALSAIKYDPQLKEYYNNKKEQGKNGMLVLNNIRCKIISRVFSVVSRQTPFVDIYKFAS
ncbi:transposase [Flavobacterium amniphilum]|uniref:transposase n=1 Tax=Flavobacterium amniphilum TaxID=1834035 RepID=UPI00202A6427|nr:transposase [Flavobacterium amniphilum]MCL9807637.1 transposase [Flavobacterium amniphilum]